MPVKVAIVIRMMAGSSYQEFMQLYGVSETGVRRCFKQFSNTVFDLMSIPRLPKDEARLQELAMGFKTSRLNPNPLAGCIGAIDGLCV